MSRRRDTICTNTVLAQVRADEPATLESELSLLMGGALRTLAFSKDFKKHCEAMALLVDACGTMPEEVRWGLWGAGSRVGVGHGMSESARE